MSALEQRLATVGEKRRAAEVDRRAASVALVGLVRQAAEAGWSKTKIAAVSGLSRQYVHEILRD